MEIVINILISTITISKGNPCQTIRTLVIVNFKGGVKTATINNLGQVTAGKDLREAMCQVRVSMEAIIRRK
jgi:hypothetical protein